MNKLPGPKIVIGDNLSSHLSIAVVQKCVENNIRFVLLPPNSTHLSQPLDVAFFKPLKQKWRQVLSDWKQHNRGVFPKSEFPRLLKETIEGIKANSEKNIVEGFKACGIVPLDRKQVLKRIPDYADQAAEQVTRQNHWSDSFVDLLKTERLGEKQDPKKARGKKLNILPGKSVIVGDFGGAENDDEPLPNTSQEINNLDRLEFVDEDSETSVSNMSCDSDTDDEKDCEEVEHAENETETFEHKANCNNLQVDDFIVVKFDTKKRDRRFVGQIIKIIESGKQYEVNFLRKKESFQPYFIFPATTDTSLVTKSQIIAKLNKPLDLRRGRLIFANYYFNNVE